VIHFSFLRNAYYGDIAQFAQFLQVSQLKGQVEVVYRAARGEDQLIDPASFDQRHIPCAPYRIEDHNVLLVHEGDVCVGIDEDERDAV